MLIFMEYIDLSLYILLISMKKLKTKLLECLIINSFSSATYVIHHFKKKIAVSISS